MLLSFPIQLFIIRPRVYRFLREFESNQDLLHLSNRVTIILLRCFSFFFTFLSTHHVRFGNISIPIQISYKLYKYISNYPCYVKYQFFFSLSSIRSKTGVSDGLLSDKFARYNLFLRRVSSISQFLVSSTSYWVASVALSKEFFLNTVPEEFQSIQTSRPDLPSRDIYIYIYTNIDELRKSKDKPACLS